MKKIWFITIPLLALALALVVTREQRSPANSSPSVTSSTSFAPIASGPTQPPSVASPTQSSELNYQVTQALPQLEVVFNQSVLIEHGGALRDLVLAKDELYVRNADGVGRVVTFPPASNAADLLQQWHKTLKETGFAPELIMYPLGAPRNESTRRIVSRRRIACRSNPFFI